MSQKNILIIAFALFVSQIYAQTDDEKVLLKQWNGAKISYDSSGNTDWYQIKKKERKSGVYIMEIKKY